MDEASNSPASGKASRSALYHSAVVAIYVGAAVLAGAAFIWEAAKVDTSMATVARERGAVLFKLIELTRDWNAQHGGVYVPVTEQTQPNTYLKHPQRDVVTVDGARLTLVNPAFMTRQIAEIAERADGAKFHITSLKPIRPANVADSWETESLLLFEQQKWRERLSFFADGGGVMDGPVHRYMAPLVVKQACMKCHEVQGYKVGDIRGGISVSMPAVKLMEIGRDQKKRLAGVYLFAFLIVAGLGHFVAWRTRRHMLALEDINRGQEETIALRTGELSAANEALQREIVEVEAAQRGLAESQAKYRAVVESSQDGIVVVSEGRIVFANERMATIVGYSRAELEASGLFAVIAPEDQEWVREHHRRRLAGEKVPNSYRIRLLHKDGTTRKTVDVLAVPHREANGVAHIVVSFKDVTEKLAAEQELQIAAAVFERAAEGILVTDQQNRIIQVNPAFEAITGYSEAEVIGKDPSMFKSGRHDPAFYEEMWRHLKVVGRWEGEIWNRRKNGEIYVEWLAITTVPGSLGAGRHVATFSDITKRKQAEEIILHKANYDALTDLPNRHLFEDRLASALAIARRHHSSFALAYIDLDFFKNVNDSFGHAAGDAVLAEAAKRMARCVRAVDTVARLGGDEFALIVTDLDVVDEVEEVVRRLLDALQQPYILPEGVAHISGSVGIAVYPQNGSDDLMLRKSADEALYEAKAAGRNTYRLAARSVP